MITRYRMMGVLRDYGVVLYELADQAGPWVRFEDVEAALSAGRLPVGAEPPCNCSTSEHCTGECAPYLRPDAAPAAAVRAEAASPTSEQLIFNAAPSTWCVKFTDDKRIEINPEYTAEGAAAEFVRIVSAMAALEAGRLPVGAEPLDSQIDRLANFIMAEVPGEPSASEGAIDTAIRWMRSRLATLEADGAEAFKPCIIVQEDAGVTECVIEDVAYIAEPVFPGVHHWIDRHVAMDDGRLVGMKVWALSAPQASLMWEEIQRLRAELTESERMRTVHVTSAQEEHVRAEAAEAREQSAREEEREACAKAICDGCASGVEINDYGRHQQGTYTFPCHAEDIRARSVISSSRKGGSDASADSGTAGT